MRRLSRLSAALALAAAARPAAAQQPLAGFAEYVEQARRDWTVPGMSVAVVRGDSVVFARGFGARTLGGADAVDEHTLFAVGSTTKAFTAASVAMLVDEGKVRWDAPAAEYLPWLRFRDPQLTAGVSVRDLLTHRTGLPTADFLWYATGEPTAAVLRRVRHLPPAAAPRERYAYQNTMYAAAGEVVAAASGAPWAEFVRRRVFQPLGMARTVATYAEMTRATNVAAPHAEVDDTVRAIAHRDIDNVAPAGSVYSSAHDMARWVRAVLDSTRVAGAPGGRLVSDSAFRQLLTPQFLVPEASYYPAARLARPHFRAYGLGWFLQDYRGRLVAMHTGSIDGMSAIVGLLPEERVGVVVLANLDHAELRHALMYDVFDRFLGAPDAGAAGAPDARLPRDWSRALRPVYDSIAARGREAERRAERDRVAGTRPTLPLSAYAGSYADSLYGAVTVAVERDRAGRERLALRGAGAFAGPLEHWHYDTFRARWADRVLGTSLVVFTLDPSRRRVTGVSVGGAGVLARRADERAP